MKRLPLLLLGLVGLLLFGGTEKAAAAVRPDWDLFTYWFGKNKYDYGGNSHGLWVFYHDDEEAVLMRKGRFKHGEQRRVWTYYLPDGTLYRKEKYKRGKPTRKVKTTLYHPNGKVAVKGVALQYEDHLKIHYYWDGDWRYYAEDGKLEKKVQYNKGNPVQTKYLAPGVEGE
jgi:antitoxin component YwqK of YwqJK toxin-antitoxin module